MSLFNFSACVGAVVGGKGSDPGRDQNEKFAAESLEVFF